MLMPHVSCAHSFSSFTQPHEDRAYNLQRSSVFVGRFTSGSCAAHYLSWSELCWIVWVRLCVLISLLRGFIFFSVHVHAKYYFIIYAQISLYPFIVWMNTKTIIVYWNAVIPFFFFFFCFFSSHLLRTLLVHLNLIVCVFAVVLLFINWNCCTNSLKETLFWFYFTITRLMYTIHNRQFVISVFFLLRLFFYSVSLGCASMKLSFQHRIC